jgi:hypothetical protein
VVVEAMDHKAVAVVVMVVVQMDRMVIQHQTAQLVAVVAPLVMLETDLVDLVDLVDLTVVVDVLVAVVVICRVLVLAIRTLVVEEDIMVEDPVDPTLIQTPELAVVVDQVCSEIGHFLLLSQI